MTREGWEVTFSDLLMLMLTFFIFFISVSVFKTKEYTQFWENYQKGRVHEGVGSGVKVSAESDEIDPIPELNLPKLSEKAASILRETGEIIDQTNDLTMINAGDAIYYNEQRITLMVSESIGFDASKAELKEGVKIMLTRLIPSIKKSGYTVNITGHTDSSVSKKVDNLRLSLDRAYAIAEFMIAEGLDERSVSISGYGPFRPAFTNLTEDGRSKNRRVEVNIMINEPKG